MTTWITWTIKWSSAKRNSTISKESNMTAYTGPLTTIQRQLPHPSRIRWEEEHRSHRPLITWARRHYHRQNLFLTATPSPRNKLKTCITSSWTCIPRAQWNACRNSTLQKWWILLTSTPSHQRISANLRNRLWQTSEPTLYQMGSARPKTRRVHSSLAYWTASPLSTMKVSGNGTVSRNLRSW